jgi:hypothetical protein
MARSGDEGLEQRLDRWVEAGRQLVDGVSGARPGSRRARTRLNPGELGRWAQNKLEWLLDDEGDDDWREPWQASRRPEADLGLQTRPAGGGRRRPLEAISRREGSPSPGNAAAPRTAAVKRGDGSAGRGLDSRPNPESPVSRVDDDRVDADGAWPDDDSFSVSRWQREVPQQPQRNQDAAAAAIPARPLPRSTRRR